MSIERVFEVNSFAVTLEASLLYYGVDKEVYCMLQIGSQQLEEYLSGSLIKTTERTRVKGLLGIFSEPPFSAC